MCRLVVLQGDADLHQVVLALSPPRRLAALLYGGQEQTDQDRDDRHHHQEFNQCETARAVNAERW